MNKEKYKELRKIGEVKKMLDNGKSMSYIMEELSKKYNTTIRDISDKIEMVMNARYNERVFGRELTKRIFKSIGKNGLDIDGDITVVDGIKYYIHHMGGIIQKIGPVEG